MFIEKNLPTNIATSAAEVAIQSLRLSIEVAFMADELIFFPILRL